MTTATETGFKVCDVVFFKPYGKYYTTEQVVFPTDTPAWEARDVVELYLDGRLSGMTAVVMDGPWGYPIMFTDLPKGVAA